VQSAEAALLARDFEFMTETRQGTALLVVPMSADEFKHRCIIVPDTFDSNGKAPVSDSGRHSFGVVGRFAQIAIRDDGSRKMAQGAAGKITTRSRHQTVGTIKAIVIWHDERPQAWRYAPQRRASE
jgi:hypothetical protein